MAGITTLDNAADNHLWRERYYDDDLATGANDGTSEANAWQSLSDMAAGVAPGDRVNMKQTASPVTLGASFTFPPGNAVGPIYYRGYTTTPGDGGQWSGDATASYWWIADAGPQIFHNINFDGSSVNYTFLTNADDQTIFLKCNFTSDAQGECLFADQPACVECTFTNSGTYSVSGYEAVNGDGKFIGCKMVGKGAAHAFTTGDSEGALCFKCTFWADGGNGPALQYAAGHNEAASNHILECSAHATASDNAFEMNSWNSSWEASGIVANCVAYGDLNCFYFGHATRDSHNNLHLYAGGGATADYGGYSNFEDTIVKDTAGTLTGSPFTSAATGDLSLNATAGQGAVVRNAVRVGPSWGASGETYASACDAGGYRTGSSDGGEPSSLVASDAQSGGGLNAWDAGQVGLTKMGDLA